MILISVAKLGDKTIPDWMHSLEITPGFVTQLAL